MIKGFFLPNEVYPNSEKTLAGYIWLKFANNFTNDLKLSGNIGLRYVHTTDESSGAINFANSSQVLPDDYNGNFAAYCAALAAQPNQPVPALCKPGVTAAEQQAALAFANGGFGNGRSTEQIRSLATKLEPETRCITGTAVQICGFESDIATGIQQVAKLCWAELQFADRRVRGPFAKSLSTAS